MYINILIHTTDSNKRHRLSEYLYNKLNTYFPNMIKSHYDYQYLSIVDAQVFIYFQWGRHLTICRSTCPNYYYTDSTDDDFLNELNLYAYACRGKKVNNLDQIVYIVNNFIEMSKRLDSCLEERIDSV